MTKHFTNIFLARETITTWKILKRQQSKKERYSQIVMPLEAFTHYSWACHSIITTLCVKHIVLVCNIGVVDRKPECL